MEKNPPAVIEQCNRIDCNANRISTNESDISFDSFVSTGVHFGYFNQVSHSDHTTVPVCMLIWKSAVR